MVGKYTSSSGLILDFGGDKVTLDCGPAHVKQPYTVENAPNQFLIHVNNSGGPFTLAVAPDNSLRGSGATTVNGRLVSGMNGDNVTYKPSSQQCASPPSPPPPPTPPPPSPPTPPPSRRPTLLQRQRPSTIPASISPASTSAPTPAPTSSPAPTSTRAAMRVVISSDVSVRNQPHGGPAHLHHARAHGRSPPQARHPRPTQLHPWQSHADAGHGLPPMDCGPVMNGLNRYYVTAAKLDSSGKATLSATAATGAYFLFALVRTPNGSMIWDIPTNLRRGRQHHHPHRCQRRTRPLTFGRKRTMKINAYRSLCA